MKSDDEIERRKWRNTLKLVPIHIQGQVLNFRHEGEGDEYRYELTAILAGPRGYYLDCLTFHRRWRRTYRVESIGTIRTEGGVEFEHFWEWLVNRARIARAVADDLNLQVPPLDQRR